MEMSADLHISAD